LGLKFTLSVLDTNIRPQKSLSAFTKSNIFEHRSNSASQGLFPARAAKAEYTELKLDFKKHKQNFLCAASAEMKFLVCLS
jgi:hypothetical protein